MQLVVVPILSGGAHLLLAPPALSRGAIVQVNPPADIRRELAVQRVKVIKLRRVAIANS